MAGGSLVQELLEAGLIDDVTEANLPKSNINFIQALSIQAGRFSGEAGNCRGDVWRGGRWAAEDLMHQRL